jgi:hypothetical protein
MDYKKKGINIISKLSELAEIENEVALAEKEGMNPRQIMKRITEKHNVPEAMDRVDKMLGSRELRSSGIDPNSKYAVQDFFSKRFPNIEKSLAAHNLSSDDMEKFVKEASRKGFDEFEGDLSRSQGFVAHAGDEPSRSLFVNKNKPKENQISTLLHEVEHIKDRTNDPDFTPKAQRNRKGIDEWDKLKKYSQGHFKDADSLEIDRLGRHLSKTTDVAEDLAMDDRVGKVLDKASKVNRWGKLRSLLPGALMALPDIPIAARMGVDYLKGDDEERDAIGTDFGNLVDDRLEDATFNEGAFKDATDKKTDMEYRDKIYSTDDVEERKKLRDDSEFMKAFRKNQAT